MTLQKIVENFIRDNTNNSNQEHYANTVALDENRASLISFFLIRVTTNCQQRHRHMRHTVHP